MKTSRHLTNILNGTIDLMDPHSQRELTFQNWEKFLEELRNGEYLSREMSLFTRERGFFGMHGYFKSLAEGARMDVPTIKKDQAAATFLLHFKYPIPLAYDIKTSWSGVRPVRFMFSTLNEGFYIVERENRKGKWRNAKEHLFVPTADYSD